MKQRLFKYPLCCPPYSMAPKDNLYSEDLYGFIITAFLFDQISSWVHVCRPRLGQNCVI